MKVVILTQNDPFYTKYFFDRFLEFYKPSDFELVGVFFVSPMGDSLIKLIKRTYKFYGFKDFLRMGITYAMVKAKERLGFKTTSIAMLRKNGFDVGTIDNVNDLRFLEQLEAIKPDLIISVSCPQIFKARLLGLPKLGCVNIHSGKIPAYRGLFPNFWQMFNNEKFATVSFHMMEEKIDKGNLILEVPVEIDYSKSLTNLIKITKYAAAENITRLVRMFSEGKPAQFENNIPERYFKFPVAKDVELFKKKGLKLL